MDIASTLKTIAKDKKLNSTELRIMTFIMGSMDQKQICQITHGVLSDSLGIHRTQISRGMRHLENLKYLTKIENGRYKVMLKKERR